MGQAKMIAISNAQLLFMAYLRFMNNIKTRCYHGEF